MIPVNLRKLFIESVSWSLDAQADESVRQRLGLDVKRSRRLVRDGYEWQGEAKNHAICVVQRHARNRVQVSYSIHALPTKAGLSPRVRRRIEEMAAVYALLDEVGKLLSGDIHATIHWRFPPGTRRPVVALPLLTMSAPGLPSFEAVGIRLIHGTTSVILDLQDDGSLDTLMTLLLPKKVSPSIVEHVVAQAEDAIAGFATSSA